MDNNLTINTLVHTLIYSDKNESVRRDVSEGVNLPTELRIAHQDYVDSKTKVPGKRSLVRFDRTVAGTSGNVVISAYLVVAVPSDAAVDNADVLATVALVPGLIGVESGQLDLAEELFINREQ